jgi:hypothetical protein
MVWTLSQMQKPAAQLIIDDLRKIDSETNIFEEARDCRSDKLILSTAGCTIFPRMLLSRRRGRGIVSGNSADLFPDPPGIPARILSLPGWWGDSYVIGEEMPFLYDGSFPQPTVPTPVSTPIH